MDKELKKEKTIRQLQNRIKELENMLEQHAAKISDKSSEKSDFYYKIYREYQTLVENLPLCIAVYDKSGRFVFVNQNTERLFNHPSGKLTGKSLYDVFKKDDAEETFDLLQQVFTSKQPVNTERLIEINGINHFFSNKRIPLFDEEGEVARVMVIAEDITDRRETEARNREQVKLYRTLIENIPLLISIISKKGEVLFINDTSKILGVDTKTILGHRIIELIPEDITRDSLAKIQWVCENKKPLPSELQVEWKGRQIHLAVDRIPIFDEEGEVLSIMNIAQDITEKKHIEKMMQIQQQIDSLSSITNSLDESLKIAFKYLMKIDWVDAGGIYLLSPKKERMELVYHEGLSENFVKNTSSYPRDSLNFQVLMKKVPSYANATQFFETSRPFMIKEGICSSANLPLVYKDEVIGSLNLVSKRFDEISENDRIMLESISVRLANLIALIQAQEKLVNLNKELAANLKDLKEKQQMLIQKSKLESLGELSAGMAHEINQPLSVISLALENIIFKTKDQIPARDYFEKKFSVIVQNIDRIREIIDHVRIFSRDQGQIIFERVDVNEVIRNAYSLVREQYKNQRIDVEFDLKKDIGSSLGNSQRFEQVILNLLSNARDAIEEKGKSGNSGTPGKINIITRNASGKIYIEVRDTGIGIPKENMDLLFTPFFTTKSEGLGTGLGLPIVYGILREMNGEIIVESEPGEYTSVTITLPEY